MKNKKSTHLTLAIFTGLLLGIALGLAMPGRLAFLLPAIDLVGGLYMNALRMMIYPLVFCSLVAGIHGIGSVSATGRVGAQAVIYYTATTLLASLLGLFLPKALGLGRGVAVEMVEAGVEIVVMEVSSQGLKLHRTQGFTFDYGIFTNLEPDHIAPNEHASFEEYMACKGLLFRQCRTGIVNADDTHTEKLLEGYTCELETFGLGEKSMLRAEHLELVHTPGELGVRFHVTGLMDFAVEVPAPGRFSVYNALCAIAICRHFKVELPEIQRALKTAKVKGRIEKVPVSDKFTLLIDYAHNAMALESLLTTLREYQPGRLVCVFGCGGNRSKLRRFEMGEVSGRLADLTVITSDNPRFEEPQDIIEDIKTGIGRTAGRYVEICDRKEAIAWAISSAEEGDLIVLAGKGHEDYQEIKGKKYPMDERQIIRELLDGGLTHI